MKRAAIYVRVSTEDQALNNSLTTQRQACEAYATQHNLQVVTVASDDETGATLERPGLEAIRQLVRTKQIDALITYTGDRLHRNLVNQVLIRNELQAAGITIHYVRRGELKDTPEDRFTDNIEAAVSEYERERIRERTMRGTRGKVESGKVLGAGLPPYGYRYEKTGPDRELVIDEDQAAIVRELHERYAAGESIAAIQRDFTARRIPTWTDIHGRTKRINKRGYGEWDHSALYEMLRNGTYAGQHAALRHMQSADKREISRPVEQRIIVPTPIIVPPELWQRNQVRRESGKKFSRRNTRNPYLLRSLIRCGLCGRAMTGVRPTNRHAYYRCIGTDVRRADRCPMAFVRCDALDAAVWDEIVALILDRPYLELQLAEWTARASDHEVTARSDRAVREAALARVQEDIDHILALYRRKTIRADDIERQLAPHYAKREEIERDLLQLSQAPAVPEPSAQALAELLANYDLIVEELGDAGEDPAAQRAILERLRPTVTVHPTDEKREFRAVITGLTPQPRECII